MELTVPELDQFDENIDNEDQDKSINDNNSDKEVNKREKSSVDKSKKYI